MQDATTSEGGRYTPIWSANRNASPAGITAMNPPMKFWKNTGRDFEASHAVAKTVKMVVAVANSATHQPPPSNSATAPAKNPHAPSA